MSPVIRVDNEVMEELKMKAIELNMVFNTPNEVLKKVLGMNEHKPISKQQVKNQNYPESNVPEVNELLTKLKETIIDISPKGLYLSKNGRWVANPNTVTIKVQEARSKNLSITIYGEPRVFQNMASDLDIKPDRGSYSRFNVDSLTQLRSAINLIKYSHQLKGN